jgi:hypothetical protein
LITDKTSVSTKNIIHFPISFTTKVNRQFDGNHSPSFASNIHQRPALSGTIIGCMTQLDGYLSKLLGTWQSSATNDIGEWIKAHPFTPSF